MLWPALDPEWWSSIRAMISLIEWGTMKKILRFLFRISLRLVSRFFVKGLVILESEIRYLQGKGIGAESINLEVKLAFEFLNKWGIDSPIVLDIGANIGAYTETILKRNPRANIIAFEPSQSALTELSERFAGNERVRIVPLALGNESAMRPLWSDSSGSPLASLTKRRLGHFKIEFNDCEQVQVTTLDDWNLDARIKPDLIKLDVEGHEFEILQGAQTTLKLAKVVQFEFGGCNIDTRTFFQDFWYFFTESGFDLFRIAPSGAIRVSRYSEEDEYFRTTNYIAVRR